MYLGTGVRTGPRKTRNIVEGRNPATLMRILILLFLCLLDIFLTSLARAASGLEEYLKKDE